MTLRLAEISKLLRNRQTAYYLMIIGKACGCEFVFPEHLSGSEVQSIAFIHHAIVERTFTWPISRHPQSLTATEQNLKFLETAAEPRRIAIPRPVLAPLLGREIDLGWVTVVIEAAVIEDVARVVAEASKLDGHEIDASVKSLDGRATIECPDAPKLPPQPWKANEEALIAIDRELVCRITQRYNSLAASTLEGLSDEKKAELVNPSPSLSEVLVPEADTGDD
jgi:hypothetical protein